MVLRRLPRVGLNGSEEAMQISPLVQTFSTLADYRSALSNVINEARQSLRVFDRDLHDGAWNTPERYEALRQFLLRDRDNRLQIVLQKTQYVQSYCPRLLNLLREHSYAIAIHQTENEASAVFDPFLIADSAHYVHRFHYEHARGEAVLHDADATQIFLQRYAELWRASFVAIPATTLGL